MKRKWIFTTFFFLISMVPDISFGFIGIGTYFPQMGQWQVSEDAATNSVEFNPTLLASTKYRIKGNHYLFPQVGVAQHSTTQREYDKYTFFLLYHLTYNFWKNTHFEYGLGTLITYIGGDGEIMTLQNGSSFADFYAPLEKNFSYNTTIDLGFETYLTKNHSLNVKFWYFMPLDSDRQSYSLGMFYHYYLDKSFW